MKNILTVLSFLFLCNYCNSIFAQNFAQKDLKRSLVRLGYATGKDQIIVLRELAIKNVPSELNYLNFHDSILNKKVEVPNQFRKGFEFMGLGPFDEKVILIGENGNYLYRKGYLFFYQICEDKQIDKYRSIINFLHINNLKDEDCILFNLYTYDCCFIVVNNKLYIQPNWNLSQILPAKQMVDCCWDNIKPKVR